jgi:hypothetical protein
MGKNFGKGLDVGTSNLVSIWTEDGTEIKKCFRDCYYPLRGDQLDFVKSKGEWNLTVINGNYYALGEDAFKTANLVGDEVRRPMAKGVLNPKDDTAKDIMEVIITSLIGPARTKGEICVASIPAESSDGEVSTIFHKGAIKKILSKLGYTFQPINEGYATLLALNPTIKKTNEAGETEVIPFSGIAISFGGGMVNLCLAYRSNPLLQISTSKSGDWVDEMTAMNFQDVQPNQVSAFKEKFFGFGKEYTDAEIQAIPGYKSPDKVAFFKKMMVVLESVYEELIQSTLEEFSEQFSKQNISSIDDPLEIVISGGTSAPEGFEDKIHEVLNLIDFPVQVSGVRRAENPLNSTATGAYVWALNLEAKRQKSTPVPAPAAEPTK